MFSPDLLNWKIRSKVAYSSISINELLLIILSVKSVYHVRLFNPDSLHHSPRRYAPTMGTRSLGMNLPPSV